MRKWNFGAFYGLIILVCVGVIIKGLPEFSKLQASKEELTNVKHREAEMHAQADQQLREYRALEQDPYFLEIYGRDRLDLYKEGERVFRFARPQ